MQPTHPLRVPDSSQGLQIHFEFVSRSFWKFLEALPDASRRYIIIIGKRVIPNYCTCIRQPWFQHPPVHVGKLFFLPSMQYVRRRKLGAHHAICPHLRPTCNAMPCRPRHAGDELDTTGGAAPFLSDDGKISPYFVWNANLLTTRAGAYVKQALFANGLEFAQYTGQNAFVSSGGGVQCSGRQLLKAENN